MIYADNAATTSLSSAAFKAMLPYLRGNYGNPSSMHLFGIAAQSAVENARNTIASILNVEPENIYFTSGGTEADNWALRTAYAIRNQTGKNHIISSAFEHHAVLNVLDQLQDEGFEVTLLDVHEDGLVRPEELEQAIQDNTGLVSIMYVNNEIGTIQPIQQIAEICNRHHIQFHTDAVQAVGHLPINIEHIDMLSASAHKFHGPKGVGFLYCRNNSILHPMLFGGSQERNLRAGTENVAGIVGMAAALYESYEKWYSTVTKLVSLRNYIIEELSQIPGAVFNGDLSSRLANNINFSFEDTSGEDLVITLDDLGICASSGSACNSYSTTPSHVIKALGRSDELARGSLRLSLNDNTTEEEAAQIAEHVKTAVTFLRNVRK